MKIRNILYKEKLFILLIFTIALFLRIFYSFSEKITPYSDAKHYDKIAINISTGKGYTEGDNLWDDERALSWAPFYPFLLAIFYRVFGHGYPVIWTFQAIISAGICILIYLIAKKVFSQKVAILSIIISAILFNFILYSAMLLTETIYIFFVLLFFILLFDVIKLGFLLKYAILGILAGVAMLTRPLFVVFSIFLFFWEFKRRFYKRALVFITCLGLIILPWIIRNYIIYQRFIFISTAGAESFWQGNHLKATGEELPYPEEWGTNLKSLSPLKLISQGYSKGMKFIIQNPLKAFTLILKRICLFFSILRTDGWWPHMKGIDRVFSLILSLLFNLLIFGLGVIGIVFSYTKVNKYISWVRRFIYITILSLIPFIVEARYRLPVYPFMIIFASYTLSLLPKIRLAFISQDKQIIRLSLFSMFLFTLIIINSIYDLFSCLDQIGMRIFILKSGIPNPW